MKKNSATYLNWQSHGQNILIVFFTKIPFPSPGVHFESTVLKLNRTAARILAFTENPWIFSEVKNALKKNGYSIRKKHEKEIKRFTENLGSIGLRETFPENYEQYRDFVLSPRTAGGNKRRFETPRILLHKRFSGLPHDTWSIHAGRYASRKQFFYPIKVNFGITRNCNLHCDYCYLADEGKPYYEDLPLREIKKIIDNLKKSNVQLVNLFGGEPFFRKDILEIIEYIREKNMQVTINTNGTLLVESMLEQLKRTGIYSLHISLDAATEETFGYMREKSVFPIVVRNIEKATSLGLPVQINFTVTRVNFRELPSVYRLARRLGVGTFSVGSLNRIGCGMQNKDIFSLPYFFYICWVKFWQRTLAPGGKTLFYIKERCDANIYTYIDHKGYLHFCTLIPRTMPLGNLLKEDLLTIWHSDTYTRLFDLDSVKEPCRSCFFERECPKGCRAEIYARESDFFAGNTDCLRGKVSQKVKGLASFLKKSPSDLS